MSTAVISTSDDVVIPEMLLSEAGERIAAMMQQEKAQVYQCSECITPPPSDDGDNADDDNGENRLEWRSIMCEWCFQMVDVCDYRRETVEIAMSYLDRFLCRSPASATNTRHKFQLVVLSCLYLAIKINEEVEMTPRVLADWSHGKYTCRDIQDMERTLLETLQWRVHGPTRLALVQHLLVFLPRSLLRHDEGAAQAIAEVARFQSEVATCDYYFSLQRQSSTALASILNALQSTPAWRRYQEEFLQAVQSHVVDLKESHMEQIQTRLLDRMGCSISDLLPMLVCDEEEEEEEDDDLEIVTMPPATRRKSSPALTVKTTLPEGKVRKDTPVGEHSPVCVSQNSAVSRQQPC